MWCDVVTARHIKRVVALYAAACCRRCTKCVWNVIQSPGESTLFPCHSPHCVTNEFKSTLMENLSVASWTLFRWGVCSSCETGIVKWVERIGHGCLFFFPLLCSFTDLNMTHVERWFLIVVIGEAWSFLFLFCFQPKIHDFLWCSVIRLLIQKCVTYLIPINQRRYGTRNLALCFFPTKCKS